MILIKQLDKLTNLIGQQRADLTLSLRAMFAEAFEAGALAALQSRDDIRPGERARYDALADEASEVVDESLKEAWDDFERGL